MAFSSFSSRGYRRTFRAVRTSAREKYFIIYNEIRIFLHLSILQTRLTDAQFIEEAPQERSHRIL